MLKFILIITLCAPNLGAMERAYTRVLGYSVVDRGAVSAELSSAWAAANMRGHGYILLRPASNANVYLRIVQSDAMAGYRPMSTLGWNATEFLVQDPDALAKAIRQPDSGFELVGEPRSLGAGSPIRAMQAVGPAHEVLYLTRIPPGTPDMQSAKTFVDRPFIVVIGTPDMSKTQHFLLDRLGLESSQPVQARMTVLNKAFAFDVETKHFLSMAKVPPDFGIELDQYPDAAKQRPHRRGELPPAMAMVTFETDSLQPVRDLLLAPPRRIQEFPYNGRRVGTMRGAAGELMELVESNPVSN